MIHSGTFWPYAWILDVFNFFCWNRYCQGFNMLAALILQVTDKSETDALKLMIYLIEGVLPDSYFADSLRGLSVDMAVFRELLRTKLPKLSKHLDLLQNLAKEGTTSYEPPLTNVFTMQWFLTLFCNCLPQPSVLRVWDLILLEGNEILLRTALAIWQALAEKILRVRTADEFYCIMGLLTTELLENNLIDANTLIKAVVSVGPLIELKGLRDHYLYNINPLGAIPSNSGILEKQLKIYPKERIALDISTLKKQYMKLRQRQRQAHIIFSAAINRQPPPKAPVAMNHLLLGKSALVPAKRLGPPKGSIPPARVPTTLLWKDTSKQTSSSSSSDTELCDDDNPPSDSSNEPDRKSPFPDLPEDNLSTSDTSNVEDGVQKLSTSNVKTDNKTNQKSDIFKSLVSSELGVEKITDIDSEDDSVDFELFLEDRVKCLKQDEGVTDEKRVGLSRRNSEKALQIIQENSLILHRILQCQSRLSLSPPGTETGNDTDEEIISKRSQDSIRYAGDVIIVPSCSSLEKSSRYANEEIESFSHKIEDYPDISDYDLPRTPEEKTEYVFPSKYEEIIAKSKNLNEKCNDLFYSYSIRTSERPEEHLELPESKTFTNQDELIDLISNCTGVANQNDNFDETASETMRSIPSDFEGKSEESMVKPWYEKIDQRSKQYIPDSKCMEDDLKSQQDFRYDPKYSTYIKRESSSYFDDDEVSKTEQTRTVIPNMIVSFSESGKQYENESNDLVSSVEEECTNRYPSERKQIAADYETRSALTNSRNPTKLETPKSTDSGDLSEKRSFSATNSIEIADKRDERRSLSATNSIERTSSPSSRGIDENILKEGVCIKFKINEKSPDSVESNILSPPRSRLSSSNSRDFTSPVNESSISDSSRLTSPSPDRNSESYGKYSPRRTCSNDKKDTRSSLIEDTTNIESKNSPQSTFELMNDFNSPEYSCYRESKYGIEEKPFCDSSEPSRSNAVSLKDSSPSSETVNSRSRDYCPSIYVASSNKISISPEKYSDHSKDYSRILEHISHPSRIGSQSDNSTITEEHSNIKTLGLSDENHDTTRSNFEDEIYKCRFSTSPKLSSPGSYSSRSSPLLRDEERRGSASPKSPTKVFNPFPVPLSSRQNKEIGVKLGLYKK